MWNFPKMIKNGQVRKPILPDEHDKHNNENRKTLLFLLSLVILLCLISLCKAQSPQALQCCCCSSQTTQPELTAVYSLPLIKDNFVVPSGQENEIINFVLPYKTDALLSMMIETKEPGQPTGTEIQLRATVNGVSVIPPLFYETRPNDDMSGAIWTMAEFPLKDLEAGDVLQIYFKNRATAYTQYIEGHSCILKLINKIL